MSKSLDFRSGYRAALEWVAGDIVKEYEGRCECNNGRPLPDIDDEHDEDCLCGHAFAYAVYLKHKSAGMEEIRHDES